MRKKFLLEELREVIRNDRDAYHDHIILGVDSSNDGLPYGVAVKVQASPLIALGMIDLLVEKLNEAREEVLEQVKQIENQSRKIEQALTSDGPMDLKKLSKLFDNMSAEDKAFFDGIHARMMEAIMKKDEAAMKSILAEVQDYARKKNKNKGGDFDINDFKNGF